jgi:peptide/nickel transport system substrate-binding protein
MLAGIALPATATLLAACGGDNVESTATTVVSQSTATPENEAATPTGTTAGGAATEAPEEPTATSEVSEPSPTSNAVTATAPADAEVNPRHFGYPIEPAAVDGGTLVRGTQYETIDVNLMWYTGYGIIHEGLVEQHLETWETSPLLAEAWDVSDDATTWTFSLREGVTWQDGQPFTAEDVRFTFQVFGAIGFLPEALVDVEISTPDATTVQLDLATPSLRMVDGIWWIMLLPAHDLTDIDLTTIDYPTLSAHPAATGSDPARVIGTGPFKLEEIVIGEYGILVRHEAYWDGRPHLERLVWQHVPTEAEATTLLLAGEIDIAGSGAESVDPGSLPLLEEAGDIVVVPLVQGEILNLFYNLDPEYTTLFQDVRVRQALLYAIDREGMVETITFGVSEVAHGLVNPRFWAANPEGVTVRYPYDPELAAQLLDEAGWLVGPDGIREKDGQRLAFPVMMNTAEIYSNAFVILQEQWRVIGVEIEMDVVDDIVGAWEENQHVASFNIWGSPSLNWSSTFGCDGANNFAHYCNPELDTLMETLENERDPEQQIALLTQVQNMVLEDLPATPLYFRPSIAAYTTRVHNFHPVVLETTFNAETWWVDA